MKTAHEIDKFRKTMIIQTSCNYSFQDKTTFVRSADIKSLYFQSPNILNHQISFLYMINNSITIRPLRQRKNISQQRKSMKRDMIKV